MSTTPAGPPVPTPVPTAVPAQRAAAAERPAATALRARLRDLAGRLVLPGEPDWDAVRQAWRLDVDQHPLAVALPAGAEDVAAVVRAAASLGLRVAPQTTGHHAEPLGALDDTVLLRTSAMRSVRIDPERRVARVEAGALWMDVNGAAARHGLAALSGSSDDVGVVGYTLGGGVSWLARSHGLAANQVVAVEVVTADGRLRHVDATHEPALFWALRGGGGSCAVVTALEFRLFPLTEVHAGALFFPLARTAEVLDAWARWTSSVPESVTSVGRVLRFPPLPELPPFLSGQSWAVVEATCQLDAAEADRLLAPLRDLGPEIDTFATIPMPALTQLHMDPPGPVPGKADGILLRELGAEGLAAFVAAAGPDVDLPLLSVELRHLGGALAPGRCEGGAVDGLDADLLLFAVGITPTAEAAVAVQDAVEDVVRALRPWTAPRAYLNFAESRRHGDELFGDEVHARIRRVKAAYDPGDVIRANHPVRPAR